MSKFNNIKTNGTKESIDKYVKEYGVKKTHEIEVSGAEINSIVTGGSVLISFGDDEALVLSMSNPKTTKGTPAPANQHKEAKQVVKEIEKEKKAVAKENEAKTKSAEEKE